MWNIVFNIIIILLEFGLFSIPQTRFERASLSMLAMIFININYQSTLNIRTIASGMIVDNLQLNKIRRLLNDNPEEDEQVVNEIQEKMNKKDYYVNVFFLVVAYSIAIINLLSAIFASN